MNENKIEKLEQILILMKKYDCHTIKFDNIDISMNPFSNDTNVGTDNGFDPSQFMKYVVDEDTGKKRPVTDVDILLNPYAGMETDGE